VLREARDLAATKDRHPELVHPVGQDRLEHALPQSEHEVVAGGEVTDVEREVRESDSRMRLARLDEPLGDTPLIEHLDGARVKPSGPRSVEMLAAAPFDDDHVDARQRQLARQHQPGRTSACDHDFVFDH
jgi:hypothetical protein